MQGAALHSSSPVGLSVCGCDCFFHDEAVAIGILHLTHRHSIPQQGNGIGQCLASAGRGLCYRLRRFLGAERAMLGWGWGKGGGWQGSTGSLDISGRPTAGHHTGVGLPALYCLMF